jgi:hypothetical protein
MADDAPGMRWSDQKLFEMAGTLGELKNAMQTAAQDRRDLWAKLNEGHEALSGKIDALAELMRGAAANLAAIPEIQETITDHDDRIDTLEGANAARGIATAKLTTIVGTIGVALGYVSPRAAEWINDILKLGGKQ